MKQAASPTKTKAGSTDRAARLGTPTPRLSLDGPAPPILLTGPAREELVRRRAYEIWEGNGRLDGHAIDDWVTAEADVARLIDEAVPVDGAL